MRSPNKPDEIQKSTPIDILKRSDSGTRSRSGSHSGSFNIEEHTPRSRSNSNSLKNSPKLFSPAFDTPPENRIQMVFTYSNQLKQVIIAKANTDPFKDFLTQHYSYPINKENELRLFEDIHEYFNSNLENVIWALSISKGNQELSHTRKTLEQYPLKTEQDFLDAFPLFDMSLTSQKNANLIPEFKNLNVKGRNT